MVPVKRAREGRGQQETGVQGNSHESLRELQRLREGLREETP